MFRFAFSSIDTWCFESTSWDPAAPLSSALPSIVLTCFGQGLPICRILATCKGSPSVFRPLQLHRGVAADGRPWALFREREASAFWRQLPADDDGPTSTLDHPSASPPQPGVGIQTGAMHLADYKGTFVHRADIETALL